MHSSRNECFMIPLVEIRFYLSNLTNKAFPQVRKLIVQSQSIIITCPFNTYLSLGMIHSLMQVTALIFDGDGLSDHTSRNNIAVTVFARWG